MTAPRASLYGCFAAAALLLPGSLAGQNGTAASVEFARTGYRLTALGARVTVSARVLDSRRRTVPNAPIAYRTSDPDIATVTNQGVVQSRRVGRTRVWAVSGTDSASALIVVDQWASTFAFTPPTLSFDAIGTRTPLRIQLRDAVGNVIPNQDGATAQCRARDERIATMAPDGQVTSRANGVTFVRCTDRGVSDSIRVEVRQRAARVTIADKLAIGTRQVNDTFRLRVVAVGPARDTIANPRVTWATLVPGIVSINPLSGLARAVGPGTTRIVTQVGDVTDTVSVTVEGTALALGPEAAGDSSGAPGRANLQLNLISPFVTDETEITFIAVDAAGNAIAGAERDIRLSSSNERVVRVVSNTRRIVAVDTGVAWLVARLPTGDGNQLVDSMMLAPRIRGAADANTNVGVSEIPFVRPVFNVDSQRTFNRQQIDRQLDSIVNSGIGRRTSGRSLAFEGLGGHVLHETQGAVAETWSGVMAGGRIAAQPWRWLTVGGVFRTGNLKPPPTSISEDLTITDIEGTLSVWPASWIGLSGAYLIRGEKTLLGSQGWKAARVSVHTRGALVGDFLSVTAGGGIYPWGSFTGRGDQKPEITSFGGEAGLEVHLALLSLSFTYHVERFSFAEEGPLSARNDLFSTLRLRAGLKFGGR